MDDKKQKLEEEMPIGMQAIMTELAKKKGYEKNTYLRTVNDVKRLEMELYLDRQILEIEHLVKLNQKRLKILQEKRKLFEFYDDGRDPY